MLVSSLVSRRSSDSVQALIEDVWQHDQVRVELRGMLELLPEQIEHVQTDIGLDLPIPLKIHSRYTRAEILAAFNTGDGATPPTWQTGVWWDEPSKTDMFAFTLDKTHGGFSPTTRYRDYAISRELVHWESQSNTSLTSEIGQRYICHRESGTNIVLFARRDVSERAFWCLGPATYESHESARPIAFVWRLAHRLPADLYAEFAAAVA